MKNELNQIYEDYYAELDSVDKRKLTVMIKVIKDKVDIDTLAKTLAAWMMNPGICANVKLRLDSEWLPKEHFEREGAQVIGWLSTDKGFQDTTAMLIYLDGRWNWGDDSENPVKKPEFIEGVKAWPEPPVKFSNQTAEEEQ